MTTDKLRAKFEAWARDVGFKEFAKRSDGEYATFIIRTMFDAFRFGHASRDAEVEALRTKAAMWDALCDDCDANDAQRNQCAKNAITDAIELGSGALRHQYDAAMREDKK